MKFQSLLFTMLVTVLSFAQVPTITSLSTNTADPGTQLIITGTNFSSTPSSNLVRFGSTIATVTSASTTSLTVTVPHGSRHDFISVTVGSLTAMSTKKFFPKNSAANGFTFSASSFNSPVVLNSQSYSGSANQSATMIVSDVDNDGKPDIIRASSNPGNGHPVVASYKNLGVSGALSTSSFQTGVNNAMTANASDCNSMICRDLNNDGYVDVSFGDMYMGNSPVMRNNVTTFGFGSQTNSGSMGWLDAADFNADGKMDVAYVNFDPTIKIKLNTTSSSISFGGEIQGIPNTVTTSGTVFTWVHTYGDFDNNGSIDIAFHDGGNNLRIIKNTFASGSFTAANMVLGQSIALSGQFLDINSGDFDNDGDLDLALLKNDGTIQIIQNSNSTSGTISFTLGSSISMPTGAPTGVVKYFNLADINGDGKLDVIVPTKNGSNTGHICFLINNTSSSISFTSTVYLSTMPASYQIADIDVVDLNEDGKVDIAGGSIGHSVFVIQNNLGPQPPAFTTQPSISPSTICAGTSFTTNTVVASNTPTSYQWEVSTDNGTTWANATGASATTTQLTSTPSIGGTYLYRCKATNAAGTGTSSNVTLTVNALNTAGAASSSPNVCPNVAMTSVTHATTGATGIGTATGLPAGLSAAFASNTITISGTPTASGTFNYTIPLSGGCGTVNATGTIIVKGNNLAAVAQPSTTNQVYCLNATAAALTTNFTDANVYQWYVMDAANWSGQQAIAGATTNTYTPPTNVVGTKYYRCYVASCSGSNTSSAVSGAITVTDGSVWTGAVSTDPTNAGNWNSTCGSGNKIISASVTNFPVYADLTIAAGETYTVNEGARVTVNGILSNSGVLNLRTGATLVQGNSSTYTGLGIVNVGQRITGGSTAGASVGRFWYLGTPTTGANATAFYSTSSTNIVKERDEPNNAWNVVTNSSGTALTPGKGYYVRANNGTTSSATQTELLLNFTGGGLNNNPTTSAMTINCTRSAGVSFEGFNLVSNPYPSYLNWDLVTKTDVGNTMWYRSSTGSFWNSTMVFETYVAGAAGGIGTNLSGNVATKLIPPMQAFWVRVNSGSSTGSITIDNSMRSHFTSISGSTAGLRSTNDELKLFLRMNLLQGESKDQLIVYVNGNATNGFDQLDGEKMMQATLPQFYTKAGDKKIVINGLNSAKKQQALPITMELPSTGVHTFEIENLEIESGLVWLEDKQAETMEVLTEGYTYQFYGEAGVNSERFVLHFNLLDNTTPSAPNFGEVSSTSNFSGKGASVHAEAAGVVVIKLPATTEGVTDIQIRDAAGRLVYTGSTHTLETNVQLEQANGIYYVTLNSASGVEVRKVFVQQ